MKSRVPNEIFAYRNKTPFHRVFWSRLLRCWHTPLWLINGLVGVALHAATESEREREREVREQVELSERKTALKANADKTSSIKTVG